MKKTLVCLLFVFATVFTLPAASAQKKEQKEGKAPSIEIPETLLNQIKEREEIVSKLKFQQGVVTLKDGLATIKLPENFRYLDPEQAETVLVRLWGNPPGGEKSLGMLFPAEGSPAEPESWGVVITYTEDGYVKDDEAASINYDDLLKEMKENTRESNAERTKQGYEAVELIGWAAPPRYDQSSHKLYWAKELKFGDNDEHTLNYDIRALGRRGVLSLNAVAAMGQLQSIEKDMRQVLSFVEFNEGHRYGDYVAGVDKVAAYGIGALIAGKIAVKAGLFKLLLGALIAGKKFVIVALVAIAAFLKKLLSGRGKEEEAAPSITE